MRHHNYPSEHHGGSILAFIAGASVALIAAGYYLYGPRGERHRHDVDRWVRRAKFEILDKMADIENITEEQYHRIVDEVTHRFGRLREISQDRIDRARENFKGRWNEMREAARQARDEARRELEAEERDIESRFP